MDGDCLKLGGHAHRFCHLIQVLSWGKDFYASSKSVIHEDTECKEQKCKEMIFE